jgi:hypothetical protein
MGKLAKGQKVEVDVFGLGRPGATLTPSGPVPAIITGLGPGIVTVRLEGALASFGEVTVGARRIAARHASAHR